MARRIPSVNAMPCSADEISEGFSTPIFAPNSYNPPNRRTRFDVGHGTVMTPEERRDFARRMFAEQPLYFPTRHRASIMAGRILLGMSPFEARLAGGAFAYKVEPDPRVWRPNTDPFDVMWRQSEVPDDSRIVMTFQNASQFLGEPAQRVAVRFERGQAVEILAPDRTAR